MEEQRMAKPVLLEHPATKEPIIPFTSLEAVLSDGKPGQIPQMGEDGKLRMVDSTPEIELDDVPVQGSDNAVKSGGIYAEFEKKQDKLQGQAGQIMGFDAQGNAQAQSITGEMLPNVQEISATASEKVNVNYMYVHRFGNLCIVRASITSSQELANYERIIKNLPTKLGSTLYGVGYIVNNNDLTPIGLSMYVGEIAIWKSVPANTRIDLDFIYFIYN